MNKHLKLFANHTAYEAVKNNIDKPNVVMCLQEDEVHFNPDPYNGHEYVEIAGIKWATVNLGANSVTDTGLYFLWGDTQGYTTEQLGSGEGKKYFDWTDYKYGDGTSSPSITSMTKYNNTDKKKVLDLEDDAARANWGGSWRMPTTAELQALGNAVNTTWTYNYQGSGVAGIICTDKTDSSKVLFFPAVGYCVYGHVSGNGINGYYWSSSLNIFDGHNANMLIFRNNSTSWNNNLSRMNGILVRPVAD